MFFNRGKRVSLVFESAPGNCPRLLKAKIGLKSSLRSRSQLLSSSSFHFSNPLSSPIAPVLFWFLFVVHAGSATEQARIFVAAGLAEVEESLYTFP
jgi:hypothetical protein